MTKFLIGIVLSILMFNHPSLLCINLTLICLVSGLYLKRVIINLYIYFIVIIFIGGILLLLFYLTIIRTNKPSWYRWYLVLVIFLPEFYYLLNINFSTITFYIEIFNYKFLIFLILFILILILFILNIFFCKISFMRQL